MHDLPLVVAEMPIGQAAAVTIWRRNAALSLQPVIGEMPGNPAIAELTKEKPAPAVGSGGSPRPLPVSALVAGDLIR